jgi:hypothetical protein
MEKVLVPYKLISLYFHGGASGGSWLGHCTTTQVVASLIPNDVIDFFK